jgi:nitroimidazol reductase NimA-like FMN-containing flavoprotein (pyridoxamine 5'-phosphate oxidase superfamily)
MWLWHEISKCNWFGRATFIEDIQEKKKIFDIIISKYLNESSYGYSDSALATVAVIKVKIHAMTGKKSGY